MASAIATPFLHVAKEKTIRHANSAWIKRKSQGLRWLRITQSPLYMSTKSRVQPHSGHGWWQKATEGQTHSPWKYAANIMQASAADMITSTLLTNLYVVMRMEKSPTRLNPANWTFLDIGR